MRSTGTLAVVATACALVGGHVAAQPIPQVTFIGFGAGMACAEWLATGRQDEAVEQWAFGFASALAAAVQASRGDDPLAETDASRIHTWLADRCAAHPSERLSVVITRLILRTSQSAIGSSQGQR